MGGQREKREVAEADTTEDYIQRSEQSYICNNEASGVDMLCLQFFKNLKLVRSSITYLAIDYK